MSAEETRLAVERAIVELHNLDEALTLMTGAVRQRLTTAIGKLAEARAALNADETNGGAS
jgi:hypothetical protein